MQRELFGSGHEHRVYLSKNEEYVIKTPSFLTQLVLWTFNFDSKVVEDEYMYHEKMVKGSDVQIPKWRIFTNISPFITKEPKPFWKFLNRKTYIALQQKVTEDHSVVDIYQHLKGQNLDFLARKYRSNPTNFISEKGTVYHIDPTHTIDWKGILTRLHLADREKLFK